MPTNLFLAGLAPEDSAAIMPHLEQVKLSRRDILHEKARPIGLIYFPLSGVVSLLIPHEDGAMVEAGLVGREAVVGMSALSGYNDALHTAMTQVPGDALRLRTAIMLDRCRSSPALLMQVLRFSQAVSAQIGQCATCNLRHGLAERLARWLLMAHDRVEDDTIPITHEFMSMMLGTRRPGVTIAANTLKQSGSIALRRSEVVVLDRALLEQTACECYEAQRDSYTALLGWPPASVSAENGDVPRTGSRPGGL